VNRRQRDQLESQVPHVAAGQRAKIAEAVLQRGEFLAADPAVGLCQQTSPERSPMVGLEEEGFLFATDRRLLYRTLSGSTSITWPYLNIVSHRLRRCRHTRLVCALSAWSRLRGLGWGFATLSFATLGEEEFAVHGSRPFLAAIASVLAGVDPSALPPMPSTTVILGGTGAAVRCRECRGATDDLVEYCPSCGREIDWNESRRIARRATERAAARVGHSGHDEA
jgi:hypothetical protein